MTILEEILGHKRREVAAAKEQFSPEAMALAARERAEPVRPLRVRLREAAGVPVIAEVKRRSPSRGEIRADFDPVSCAKAYAEAGAAAISVLTDSRYFGGELEFLSPVREAVAVPILRKDFIVDPYQVDESRMHGADAILLIVAALSRDALSGLRAHGRRLGLDVLVEVHDEDELDTALECGVDLIGINNRDLATFEVDLGVTERLAGRVPPGVVVVAESGIFTHDQVRQLLEAGAHAVLVGESLMREPDLGGALRKLRGTT